MRFLRVIKVLGLLAIGAMAALVLLSAVTILAGIAFPPLLAGLVH